MLQELSIHNFAIIDDLNIQFSGGLTVLTGETGAGKSIILNAVNLLLGGRAAASIIRTGSETAELEVLFNITPKSHAAEVMKEHGYDSEEGLLVRRIISRSDNNRIYINGRLSTMHMLNQITENLASISGQHAHQGLLKEDQHLLTLDQFGGLLPLRSKVVEKYNEIVPLIDRLNRLNAKKENQAEHVGLLEFQKKEITEASIKPGEDIELEGERVRLKNSELLFQAVHESLEKLYGTQGSIIDKIFEVKKILEKAGSVDPDLLVKSEVLAEISFQVEDITSDLRSYSANVKTDEKRLESIEERLDTLNKLKRKYGGSIEKVITHLESITFELEGIENISEKISETEANLETERRALEEFAGRLSEKRKSIAKVMAAKVEAELETLKMPQTQFQVSINNISTEKHTEPHLIFDGKIINETGFDRAGFLIAPNVGEVLKPLASVASGGELSRVVLALKAILAESDSVATIVFDEVDAGIGGGVAEVVGRKLAALANYHQIICITHLSQIAKFGKQHFHISKSVSEGRTMTSINPLNKEERIEELARMMGGIEMTHATLEHARELLEFEKNE